MELLDSITEGAVLNTGDKVKARTLTTIEGGGGHADDQWSVDELLRLATV
jgi:hypothetical protein